MGERRPITALTAEQESAVREVGEEWAAVGLATGPGDRAAAENAVRAAYLAVGLPPPRFIVRLGSPWAGQLGQSILPKVIASVVGSRYSRVRARLRRREQGHIANERGFQAFLSADVFPWISTQVSDEVDQRVMALLRERLGPQIAWHSLVGAHVRDHAQAQREGTVADTDDPWAHTQVQARVDRTVVPRVQAELTAQVAAQAGVPAPPERPTFRPPPRWWRSQPRGMFGMNPYAFTAAMERIGVTGLDVHHEQRIARNGSWWWAFRDYAVLTARPDVLRLDAQGRVHCADGPAAVWPDGWTMHAWHGTRVPAELIEVGWDTTRTLRERNAEVRRCAIERMGWPEFIAAAGLRQVGRSEPDPGNPGCRLSLYDLPTRIYNVPVRVLLCTNASPERDGTRRQYGLTVPADTPDPTTAAAGLLGLTREQYLTLTRAT
ncbi:DUF6745 domain-containing protein [Wenjunlia tyrosinilytica]|uniref:DUF6745 domain-containing protein n=1 Tax=Wenjunlia tyrosinilytica TaxID=1544741 RepID=A0A917ZEG0_9ACTN|nr:hypothetical protein [Wenjunlia tyrosinilytica]GGO80419.1 hypothetical protein GCM10012280_02290 [Wenjunlia tyrosinilytica]